MNIKKCKVHIAPEIMKIKIFEILKFEPFESDLENAIIDSTADKIMNGAFSDRDCITVTANTKFILVSWDVGRPGLWYGV